LVYNFALPPLVLQALATGRAAKLTHWAQSLALPSDRVTFFNFLASHDGIGLNPARGILSDAEIEALAAHTLNHGGFISYRDAPDGSRQPYELNINYLDALSNPGEHEPPDEATRKFLTAHAIMLSLQGIPGIYFHSLFGSRGDPAGAKASGLPRRINREKLERHQLEAELRDRNSVRARVWQGLKQLLLVRRAQTAFHPQASQQVLSADARLFAVCRTAPEDQHRVLCLHNCSAEVVSPTGLLAELMSALTWTDLLTGEQHRPDESKGGPAELAGFQTRWLRAGTNDQDARLPSASPGGLVPKC
jgi:sucrose phosphorylase